MFSDDDVAQAVAAAVGAGLRDVDLGVIEAVMRATADVWRKRVEGAADALADVLPGEVGRLDLLARIAELKRQRWDVGERLKAVGAERDLAIAKLGVCEAALQDAQTEAAMGDAEIARLTPSGQVAEDVKRFTPASGEPPEAYTVAELRDAVVAFVRGDPCQDEPFKNAIANGVLALATKAQGYEAAVADCH